MTFLIKISNKTTLSILIFSLFTIFASAQEIVADTIIIKFKYDTIIPSNYYIYSVTDNRKSNPRLVAFSQKKKYILIPVDQEICVDKKLAYYIQNNRNSIQKSDTIFIGIDYFIIEKYNGRFFNTYTLMADLPIKTVKNGIPFDIGTLSYNYEFKPPIKGTAKPEVCEAMLENWSRSFKIDLLSVNSYLTGHESKPENLLELQTEKSRFFNSTVGTVVAYNFWQVDGDLYFTRPETRQSQWFSGSFIRYQYTPGLEMLGFGKKSEHFYERINEHMAYDVTTNLLLGLNKWKNTNNIKLQQVFQLSFSSNQSILFAKKNQPGWIFKTGLFENIYYIIQKPLKFQIGLYIGVGYKF